MPELAVVRLSYESIRPEIGEDMIRKIMSSFPPNVFSGFGIEDFELTPDLIVEKPTDRTMNKYPYDVEPGVSPKELEKQLKSIYETTVLALSPIPIMGRRPHTSLGCGIDNVTPRASRFYRRFGLGVYDICGYGYERVAIVSYKADSSVCSHELGHTFGLDHHLIPMSLSDREASRLGEMIIEYHRGEIAESGIPMKFRCVMGFESHGPLGTTFCDSHYQILGRKTNQ